MITQLIISSGGGGGGGGTVTSVALALPSSVFDISGSPVTSAGTLTGTFKDQNANLVFAGPASGAADVPTFRALVADDIGGFAWTQGGNSTVNNNFLGPLTADSLVIGASSTTARLTICGNTSGQEGTVHVGDRPIFGAAILSISSGEGSSPTLLLEQNSIVTSAGLTSGQMEFAASGLYFNINSTSYSILGIGSGSNNLFTTDVDLSGISGIANTIYGSGAGTGFIAGGGNTLFGAFAGQGSFISYDNMTFIGISAGVGFGSGTPDGQTDTICIGNSSGFESTDASRSIAIGTFAYLTGPNQCVIGGVADFQVTDFYFGGTNNHAGDDTVQKFFNWSIPWRYNQSFPDDLSAHQLVINGSRGTGITTTGGAGDIIFKTQNENLATGSALNDLSQRLQIIGGVDEDVPYIFIGPDLALSPARATLTIMGSNANTFSTVMLGTGVMKDTPIGGELEYNGDQWWITTTADGTTHGLRSSIQGLLFTCGQTVTVADTDTPTSIIGAGIGDINIYANTIRTNSILRVTITGDINIGGLAAAPVIRASIDGTDVATTTVGPANTGGNTYFTTVMEIIINDASAPATVVHAVGGFSNIFDYTVGPAPGIVRLVEEPGAGTFDNSADAPLVITVENVGADNTFRVRSLCVEILN